MHFLIMIQKERLAPLAGTKNKKMAGAELYLAWNGRDIRSSRVNFYILTVKRTVNIEAIINVTN